MISPASSQCTCACGSAWMGDLQQNGLIPRPAFPVGSVPKMFSSLRRCPCGRFLSAVNGSTLSTWCRIPGRFNVREIAWESGWCWFTCAPALGQRSDACLRAGCPRRLHRSRACIFGSNIRTTAVAIVG